MSSLPEKWCMARVGDLIDLGPKNDCPADADVGFVPLARLGVHYRARHTFETKKWTEVKKGYTHFADGDVLLARITPSFENGKAGIARGLPGGIGAGSTEYFVCRPEPDALLPEYLLAHFKTPKFLQEGEQVMTGAVGQQRVPKQYVLDSMIPLAPLNEQRRIVDKLDAVLARVDACRERLGRVPDILKRFRQSVLAAATSGELTADWRKATGSDDERSSWARRTIGEVCESSFYGPRFARSSYTDGEDGIPTIRTTDMTADGRIQVTSNTPRVLVDEGRIEKFRVQEGDLLVTRSGSIGVMAVFDGTYLAIPSAYLIRFRFHAEALPQYVLYCLMAPEGQERLGLSATAIAQPNINAQAVKQIEIFLPSRNEQAEIIVRVEELFSYANRVEASYRESLNRVKGLTPAVLQRAFRGKLVPQDLNDEPAGILLDRVRTESAEKRKRTRKKRTAHKTPRPKKREVWMLKRSDTDETYLSNILRRRGPMSAEALWTASQLSIDDFYEQLKEEETCGLLVEKRGDSSTAPRILEAAA